MLTISSCAYGSRVLWTLEASVSFVQAFSSTTRYWDFSMSVAFVRHERNPFGSAPSPSATTGRREHDALHGSARPSAGAESRDRASLRDSLRHQVVTPSQRYRKCCGRKCCGNQAKLVVIHESSFFVTVLGRASLTSWKMCPTRSVGIVVTDGSLSSASRRPSTRQLPTSMLRL